MLASVCLFTATSLLLSHAHHAYEISGWVAACYRAAAGLSMIWLLQVRTGRPAIGRIFTRPLLFVRGFVGGATIPAYYISIMELGPGRAGLIAGSWPLFAALFAALLIGESLSRKYFIYIGLALIGLAAVFAANGIGIGNPAYDGLAIAGAAAGGLCVVMIRHLRHTESTGTIFASQCVFTLLIGLPVARGSLWIDEPVALGLVVLASLSVALAQLSLTEAFRHISVAKGSTLQMLTPALTVLGSALLLGENFNAYELVGGACILLASYQIALAKAAK